MKRFPLESLLTYRQEIEKILQEELAVLQAQLSCEKEKLKQYRLQKQSWEMELTVLQERGDLLPAVVEMHRVHLGSLAQKIARQEAVVDRIGAAAERKRHEWGNASRDRKGLEKLDEQFHEQVEVEEKRHEVRFLGELALDGFLRRRLSR